VTKPTLYEQALGIRYAVLPAAVQQFHRLSGHCVLHGWVQTEAAGSLLAQVLARCLGTPRGASKGPLQFELLASEDTESWTRNFPQQTMCSTLQRVNGQLEEKLGAARLRFELQAEPDALRMQLVGLRFLGLPCPIWLMPRITAMETGHEAQLHFEVTAAWPLVGIVASYSGHLDLKGTEMAKDMS
jgi:hypothetical protein